VLTQPRTLPQPSAARRPSAQPGAARGKPASHVQTVGAHERCERSAASAEQTGTLGAALILEYEGSITTVGHLATVLACAVCKLRITCCRTMLRPGSKARQRTLKTCAEVPVKRRRRTRGGAAGSAAACGKCCGTRARRPLARKPVAAVSCSRSSPLSLSVRTRSPAVCRCCFLRSMITSGHSAPGARYCLALREGGPTVHNQLVFMTRRCCLLCCWCCHMSRGASHWAS